MTPDAHGHAHAHAHSHGGHADAHSHAPSTAALAGDPRARRALTFALLLGLVILVAEVIAGVVYGSLALLGDAAHMATDVAAYAVALWAARVATRPPSRTRTFGHGRVEILAALANGATLLAASAWILVEAVRRLIDPTPVDGAGMSVVAAIGLVANVVVLWVLWRAGSDSLNMRGALLHAAGDLLGSIAALSAGIIIATTGWERADPLASLLLTMLIIAGAWRLVRQSADVLLDAAPAGVDAEHVAAAIVAVDGVLEAHDVHVWTMAPGTIAASAHVRADARADGEAVLVRIEQALRGELSIDHTTIQLRIDRGSRPIETVPLMQLEDAVDWATDHIARANPDLSRAVISAAAGAAAIGIAATGRISPVTLSSRTLQSLGRRPGAEPPSTEIDPPDQA